MKSNTMTILVVLLIAYFVFFRKQGQTAGATTASAGATIPIIGGISANVVSAGTGSRSTGSVVVSQQVVNSVIGGQSIPQHVVTMSSGNTINVGDAPEQAAKLGAAYVTAITQYYQDQAKLYPDNSPLHDSLLALAASMPKTP